MKKLALIALAANLLLVACKKEEKEIAQTPSTKAADYFPMSVGNYWVYEIFKIDTSGNETNVGIRDSVFVSGKELINGEEYYNLSGGNFLCLSKTIRDSSGYLINSNGVILFGPNDFSDTLGIEVEMLNNNDTLYVGYANMEKVPEKIQVGAGSFDALLCRNKYNIHLPGAVLKNRQLLEYRAAKVGMVVKQCAGLSNPDMWEGRLVRYHINQ